jgi:hypothetical protein
MKKLRLDLEALEIDTFAPEASESSQTGTVAAYIVTRDDACYTQDYRNAECVFGSDLQGHCSSVCYTAAYDCTADPQVC